MFVVIVVLFFLLNFLFCVIMVRKLKMFKRLYNILMFFLVIIDLFIGLLELILI